MHLWRQYGQVVLEHHVLCGRQQSFADFTAWVELCKVSGLEASLLHQCDSQCVAHCQLGHRRTRRREVHRTGFLLYAHVQVAGRVFGQQRLGIATHADDRYLHVEHHRDKPQQLVSLSGV